MPGGLVTRPVVPRTYTFGSREEANAFRDEHGEHSTDRLDRRHKTVELADDAPEYVHEQAATESAASREERERPPQLDLTAAEREAIDFTEGRASVPHARNVKGIMRHAGVDDWLAFYDPTLTVDEHRGVAESAATEGGGERLDVAGGERQAREQLASAESAQGERCDHARGFCELGDADACEFLHEVCGYSDDEIRELMGSQDTEQLTGPELGLLKRSWGGYLGAVAGMKRALDELDRQHELAHQAFAAINAVRREHGQDELTPLKLEELEAMLREGEQLGHLALVATDQEDQVDELQGAGPMDLERFRDSFDPMAPLPEEERGIRAEELVGTALAPDDLTIRATDRRERHRTPRERNVFYATQFEGDEAFVAAEEERARGDLGDPADRAMTEHRAEAIREATPAEPDKPGAEGDMSETAFKAALRELADQYAGWRVEREPGGDEWRSGRGYAKLDFSGEQSDGVTPYGFVTILTNDAGGRRTYQASAKIGTSSSVTNVHSGESVATGSTLYDGELINGSRSEVIEELRNFFEHGETSDAAYWFRRADEPDEPDRPLAEPDQLDVDGVEDHRDELVAAINGVEFSKLGLEIDPDPDLSCWGAEGEVPIASSPGDYGYAAATVELALPAMRRLQEYVGIELGSHLRDEPVEPSAWWQQVYDETVADMSDELASCSGEVPVPWVEFGRDGTLKASQEGRHRTLAAQAAGMDRVPLRVVFNDESDGFGAPALAPLVPFQNSEGGTEMVHSVIARALPPYDEPGGATEVAHIVERATVEDGAGWLRRRFKDLGLPHARKVTEEVAKLRGLDRRLTDEPDPLADEGESFVDDRPQQSKLGTEDPTQHRESRQAVERASAFGVDDRSDPSRGPESKETETIQRLLEDPSNQLQRELSDLED